MRETMVRLSRRVALAKRFLGTHCHPGRAKREPGSITPLCAGIVAFAVLAVASISVARVPAAELTFDWRDQLKGRPANFYELVFQRDPEVCRTVLDALNEPQAPSADFKMPAEYGKLDVQFFLKSRLSVDWEARTFIFPVTRSSGETVERTRDNFETAVLDIFNHGRDVLVARSLSTLHDVDRHDIFVSTDLEERSVEKHQYAHRPYWREHGPIEFRQDEVDFSRVVVSAEVFGPRPSTLAQAMQHAANDYSYLEVISAFGKSFTLILPARTLWFEAERYSKDIRVYVLRSADLRQHELTCEFRSRYVQVDRRVNQ